MMLTHAVVPLLGLGLCMALAGGPAGDVDPAKPTERDTGAAKSFYDFTMKDIDGHDVALAKYKGQVCLVVNVASR